MIQPEDIRRKADNLYRDFLCAWLDGDDSFFPREIRGRKKPDSDDLAAAIQSMRRLREGSKGVLGFGYCVEWREVNSRRFGRNQFAGRIFFETQDDYLRFIGKQREFATFVESATRMRSTYPALQTWIRSNVRLFIETALDLEGLLHVLQFFHDNPRPNRFARELPIPVDTKFIDRHGRILREWFDIILPPHAIRADEDHFERRYGLRYKEPHLLVRFLDIELQRELGFPCAELSLPVHTLGELPIQNASAFIVENKVNLLTLPLQRRVIGLGGLGDGVTLLRYVPWLGNMSVTYWGDLDVEGFEILSSIRSLFPHTQSFLMDEDTLDRLLNLTIAGTGAKPDMPPHLTEAEQAAFARCRDENLRLEQERIPQDEVLALPIPDPVCLRPGSQTPPALPHCPE